MSGKAQTAETLLLLLDSIERKILENKVDGEQTTKLATLIFDDFRRNNIQSLLRNMDILNNASIKLFGPYMQPNQSAYNLNCSNQPISPARGFFMAKINLNFPCCFFIQVIIYFKYLKLSAAVHLYNYINYNKWNYICFCQNQIGNQL